MPTTDEKLHAFYRRLWEKRILPQLSAENAPRQEKRTRRTARWASASGRFVDSLLGLRGKPFTRAFTSIGVDLSMPQTWDWKWFGRQTQATRERLNAEAEAAAAKLEFDEALSLFGLSGSASHDDLKAAWRAAAHRWHPDRARSEEERQQAHSHFVTLQAAYERLRAAYEAGKIPSCDD